MRVGNHLIAFFGQASGGFDLVRNRDADLVDDVQQLLVVDEDARRKRHVRARRKHILELLEQIQEVQRPSPYHRAYSEMRVPPWWRVLTSVTGPSRSSGSADVRCSTTATAPSANRPDCARRSHVWVSASPSSYGGSAKTRSKGPVTRACLTDVA